MPCHLARTLIAVPVLTALAVLPAAGQEAALTVKETFATTGKDNGLDPLGAVEGLVETPSGDIWVADPLTGRIVALSAEGEPLRKIAGEGPGPGEVEVPYMLAALPAERGTAVYDVGRNSIDLFGPSGAFLDRVRLRYSILFPKSFVVLPDGRFVVSGGQKSREESVFVLGQNGEIIGAFLPRREVEAEGRRAQSAATHLTGGALGVLPTGDLLFSRASPHQILRLGLPGGERTVIASDRDLLEFPGLGFYDRTEDGAWIPRFWYPPSVFVAAMPDGKILNVVRWQEDDRSLFQLYGPAGRLLDSLETDRAYTPFHLTRNGRLLASYRRPVTDEQVVTALEIRY